MPLAIGTNSSSDISGKVRKTLRQPYSVHAFLVHCKYLVLAPAVK